MSESKKRPPRIPFAVLVLGLVAGTMALLLALNTASAANEVSRHDAAVQDEQLNAQIVALQNEVALSAAPQNIAQIAQGLGMVPAGNPAFLRIDTDGSVKVLGSPSPASAPYTPPPAAPKPTKPKTSPTPTATSTAAATAGSTPTVASTPTAAPTPTDTPTEALPGGPR
jgi:hypothetical protein